MANGTPATHGADPREIVLGLGAGVAILRDSHDCAAIMKRIEADNGTTLLEEETAGPLDHYLIVKQAVETADGQAIKNYRIDSATADLLRHFEVPKSYWRCCLEIAQEESAAFPDWEDVEQLCRTGVLVAKERQLAATA